MSELQEQLAATLALNEALQREKDALRVRVAQLEMDLRLLDEQLLWPAARSVYTIPQAAYSGKRQR